MQLNIANNQQKKVAKLRYCSVFLIKWSSILFLITLFIGAGQLAQYTHSFNDYRKNAISVWTGKEEARKIIAAEFIKNCIEARPERVVTNEFPIKDRILLSECAGQVGASNLNQFIRSNDFLHSAAWPLSIFTELELSSIPQLNDTAENPSEGISK